MHNAFCPLELLASCRLLHSHPSRRRCSAAQIEHQSRRRATVSPQSLPWQQTPLSTSPCALAGHHGSTQERRNIQYLPGNKHIVGCSPTPSLAAAHRSTPALQHMGITPSPASPLPSQTSAPAAPRAGTRYGPCSIRHSPEPERLPWHVCIAYETQRHLHPWCCMAQGWGHPPPHPIQTPWAFAPSTNSSPGAGFLAPLEPAGTVLGRVSGQLQSAQQLQEQSPREVTLVAGFAGSWRVAHSQAGCAALHNHTCQSPPCPGRHLVTAPARAAALAGEGLLF